VKKKLLFAMNNLNCGGAEKSLVSLLQSIDYRRYEVDLFLFKHEGMFMRQLPPEVVLLDEPPHYRIFDMPVRRAVAHSVKSRKPGLAVSRLQAGVIFKTEKNRARCEQRVWKYASRSLAALDKQYDAAIGYLEKNPIYFVVEKVKARCKLGFIHTHYDKLEMDGKLDSPYFNALDYIVSVSDECVAALQNRFPQNKHKIVLMENIVSKTAVRLLSKQYALHRGAEKLIVSVGRLHPLKGFDKAVDACEMLVKDGFRIKWIIVGEGGERPLLERKIKEKGLENHFLLAGAKENPYPYIYHCDLYVQTSIYEGRCLTITEAKILKKPIVTTNFSVVYDQIEDGHNGLIVEQDAAAIYEGIKRLLDDEALRGRLIQHLEQEQISTEDEIDKLYQWIG